MEPRQIAPIIAALAFFGLMVVCPLVMLFLRHQRLMAKMFHDQADNDTHRRLEVVEYELRQLKALHHEQVIKEDDQHELRQRIT